MISIIPISMFMLSLIPPGTDGSLPARGERWAVGSTHVVGLGCRAGTEVAVSADDGASWVALGKVEKDRGGLRWTIAPGLVSDRSRLRLLGEKSGQKPDEIRSERFAIVPSQAVPTYRWVSVQPKAAFGPPRDGAGALVFQDRLWLIGGWNPGDKAHFPRICNNEVWNSADGKEWTLIKPNTFLDRSFDPKSDWEGRHTAGYAVYKNQLWIVGGDANQGHHQDDVWKSADGKSWTLLNNGRPAPWAPRALHTTLVFQDKLWVIGGQTMPGFGGGKEKFYRDAWTTTDGEHWTEVPIQEPAWSPRGMIGGAAILNDRIWILGGGTYDTPTTPARQFFNDVWSSADGKAWTRHTLQAPWTARQYHDVATFDNRLWVLEGYSGQNRNDVWYSLDGSNWYEVPDTPWLPRHAASVFVFQNALWMVAGNNMQPDVWKLVRD